jgi:antitoxin component YwqK of YwqJK toxin-antitoxin module
MNRYLSAIYAALMLLFTEQAFAAPFKNCLCGVLPARAVADSVWYGTAGKKNGTKQEFSIKEVLSGPGTNRSTLIHIVSVDDYQDSLEEGRDYVVVVKNTQNPTLAACQTVNVHPYYERRNRAFPGPNNPVECKGTGLKSSSTPGSRVLSTAVPIQKLLDWSLQLQNDQFRDMPYFTIWKGTPGDGPRISVNLGSLESLTTFKNGIANGWMIERDRSGIIGWSGNLVDGKRDGVFNYYYDGTVAEYRNGLLIKWKGVQSNIDPATFAKDSSIYSRYWTVQKSPLKCVNKDAETVSLIRVEDKKNKELIAKEFTCKNGLADGDHKIYNWLGTLSTHSELRKGFLHGKVRIYRDGALDEVAEFVEGEQIGPSYSYSGAKESWGGVDPGLGQNVEMDTNSNAQYGKRIASSFNKRKNLWDMESRVTFVGISIDQRKQLVPSLAYGPMPCHYTREWSCDMSTVRFSAFLGERKGFAIELTGGEYGIISDLISVGARFDETYGGGPMASIELGIAYFTLLVRGTWFVPKQKGEIDVGLNFTLALGKDKKY